MRVTSWVLGHSGAKCPNPPHLKQRGGFRVGVTDGLLEPSDRIELNWFARVPPNVPL